ncbi:FxsA family protein [Nonomuraea sp. NPDC048916]|uniref:FxsA family protein n=1 Tax=Nonomuraea sp. NPDC048916 TaxID=3154232 RepID=UPI0033FDE7A3
MRLLLLLAFLAVPVIEIWLLLQVGSVIGGWTTVAVLIAVGMLGAWLVRREGRRAWRVLQEALQTGRMPDRELAEGGLILAGGVLLLVPGFLSDVVGLACVLPFTRPMMRRLGGWFFDRRVKRMAAASPYTHLFASPGGVPHHGPQGGRVVHGEVIRDDREPGREERAPGPAAIRSDHGSGDPR